MLPEMRLKTIAACLLMLGFSMQIAPRPAPVQAAVLTTTNAVRFGAPDESAYVADMDSKTTADGKTYLAVLEQRNIWQDFPQEPPEFPFSAPSSADTDPADTGTSGGTSGGYKDIRVLRVLDVTTDEWMELFSIEYEQDDWPTAVEFVGLADGQLLVAVLAVNDLDKLVFYDLNGAKVGETALPDQVDDLGVLAYNAFDVAYTDGDFDLQPLVFVVGSAMNADDIPCVVCVAPDDSAGFVVAWKKTYPDFEGEEFTDISAVTDGTSAVLLCLSQAAQLVSNKVLEIRCVNGKDSGTVSTLLTSEDPLKEFVGVAAAVDVVTGVRMYYALANEETAEGGTKAVLYYYWIVDEYSPPYTSQVWVAEPCEPGGSVEAKCLCGARDVLFGTGETFFGVYIAGGTTGSITGCATPYNGGPSDAFFAAVDVDGSNGLVAFDPVIDLVGTSGTDEATAVAAGRHPLEAVKKKASRMAGAFVAVNVSSNCPYSSPSGAFTLSPIGGTGTDPIIIELKTPAAMIGDLIAKVEGMNLHQGIENSLDVKLENAQKSLESLNAGNRQDAVNKLQAFINECAAQSGKSLTAEQADGLSADAQEIIDILLL